MSFNFLLQESVESFYFTAFRAFPNENLNENSNSSHFTLKSNFNPTKIKSPTKTYERRFIITRTLEVIGAITSAAPREEMNELYQKINNYVYEIRMIELDEYLHGMNRKKIDMEKAYELIIDAPDSECNAVLNFWKGHFADPGLEYFKSSRVEENESKAKAFYRKAVELDIEGMAEGGDQYAQACLGVMYQHGWGVDKNEATAVEWYRKAAEQGYATAQRNLGEMYQYGSGVDKNESTAVEWYRKAAKQGYATAQRNLGYMYQYGLGVDRNYSSAVEWYRNAAEQGYATAQINLGLMYQHGRGVDKNESTAAEWYRKAGDQGHAAAQHMLDHLTKQSSI